MNVNTKDKDDTEMNRGYKSANRNDKLDQEV